MEEVHKRMTSHQNEMKLYMEIADNPFNDTVCYIINYLKFTFKYKILYYELFLQRWFPEGNDHMIVFLKYFDPDKQAFE